MSGLFWVLSRVARLKLRMCLCKGEARCLPSEIIVVRGVISILYVGGSRQRRLGRFFGGGVLRQITACASVRSHRISLTGIDQYLKLSDMIEFGDAQKIGIVKLDQVERTTPQLFRVQSKEAWPRRSCDYIICD